MSADTLARVASHAMNYFEYADVVFHAGEPLTVGLGWFKDAVAIFDGAALEYGRSIRFGVQTNGVLVDAHWCDFFVEHDFTVGVSLDGPATIHDSARRTLGGRGSHARSERGFRMLRDAGLNPSILAVLTEVGLRQPDKLYDYFTGLGAAKLGFNIEDATAAHLSELEGVQAAERLYEEFIGTFIRRLRADTANSLKVREVEDTARAILAFHDYARTPDADVRRPLRIVSYDINGNFGTFCPELMTSPPPIKDRFTLGNVATDRLANVETGTRLAALSDQIASGVEACASSCDYFSICGGGKPSTKIFELGSLEGSETLSCRLRVQAVARAVSRAVLEQPSATSMAS